MNSPGAASAKRYRLAAFGGFGLLALVMVSTVRDYGVTWDEPDHRDYGQAILAYYGSGCVRLPADRDLNLYGGAFDAVAAVAERVSPFGPWTTRHLCTLALGLLGIAGAWRVGLLLGGSPAGVSAGALLAATPAWYGHAFNNPQDIPFAAGYIWSLALMLRVIEALPAPSWPSLAGLGVVLGLTWGVRVGGVLLAAYFLVAAAVRLRSAVLSREVAGRIAFVLGLAWVVMLAGWPAAQQDPVAWPASALAEFTRFTRLPFGVVFDGRVLAATDIPWTYVPTYLLLTLPEPEVLLLAGGLAAGLFALRSRRGSADRAGAGRLALVAAAAVTPAAFVILRGSVLFNGIRHLLFILPPLACLAGTALTGGLQALQRRGRGAVLAALGLLATWGGWHATRLAGLHPYEYLSYNAFAGGLPGAFQRYDLDYWGATYPEALRLVAARAGRLAGAAQPPWRVAACGAPRALAAELPAGFTFASDPNRADFLVGLIGAACGSPPGSLLGYVGREGIPLGYAMDLRPARAAGGRAAPGH